MHKITALGEFGSCIGVILQVLDDCRDILADLNAATSNITTPLFSLMKIKPESLKPLITEKPKSNRAIMTENLLQRTNMPVMISGILLEWRRRALESLTSIEKSAALDLLKGMLDCILEMP